MKFASSLTAALLLATAALAAAQQTVTPEAGEPAATRRSARPQAERVVFRSMDEPRTELTGYLYAPAGASREGGEAVWLELDNVALY